MDPFSGILVYPLYTIYEVRARSLNPHPNTEEIGKGNCGPIVSIYAWFGILCSR